MVWKRKPACGGLVLPVRPLVAGNALHEVYPPADARKELLCAVVPNPPRVVPDGLTAGVEVRALLVNAADCGFGGGALVVNAAGWGLRRRSVGRGRGLRRGRIAGEVRPAATAARLRSPHWPTRRRSMKLGSR